MAALSLQNGSQTTVKNNFFHSGQEKDKMKIINFNKKLFNKHHQIKPQITISMDTNIKRKKKSFGKILIREIINVTVHNSNEYNANSK